MSPKRPKAKRSASAVSRDRDILIARCVICTLILLLTFAVGALVFVAVCRSNAGWSDISSPVADTDMGASDIEPSRPYGDGFISDMSEYEEYINPIREMRDAFLTIYGKNNPIKSEPNDLVTLPTEISNSSISLRLYPAKAVEAMLAEMKALGIPLTDSSGKQLSVTAGYISAEEQKVMFDAEIARLLKSDPTLTQSTAEILATVTISRPGESEHQSGLSVDLTFPDMTAQSFTKTDTFLWLKENCWKFGFILRYPSGKEELTGGGREPWHLRYVGRHHAEAIHNGGLCLEEYPDNQVA